LLAARTALLATVAAWRHCWWVIEQPASSLLIDHPRMQQLVRNQRVYRHRVNMAWFGGTSLKPTHLYSNSTFLSELDRTCGHVPKNPAVVRVTQLFATLSLDAMVCFGV
jgi:hypothetical protein